MNISATARQTDPTQRELRSYHPGLPRWPAGTAALAFEIWVALAVSYYIAFMLELNSAASAGTGLLILVGPTQGMVLSKAIYRILGTFFWYCRSDGRSHLLRSSGERFCVDRAAGKAEPSVER